MSRYTEDGGVIPSGVPIISRSPQEHEKIFGLYRGTVIRTVYPDDPQNSNGERIEYVVKVGRQEYPNAISMREGGGIYNYKERIRKESEKSFSGKFDRSTYNENLDGETVFVLFLEGYGNTPIIIGSEQHPRQGSYKKFKKADGRFDVEEFNGVEFLIDKDSNYTVKHVGRKSPDGKILNQAAVDSQIKMFGNGDIELNTHGTEGTSDLRMKFTKADKKAEIYAQDDKIIMDSAGIKIEDKNSNRITQNSAGTKVEDNNGNIIEMKGGQVHVTVNGTAKVDVSGSAQIDVGGATTVNSNGATVNSPNITMNAPAGVNVNTPLMNVSGLLSCAGIGAGAAPVAGEANIAGKVKAIDVEASGAVQDMNGTMQEMRDTYNGHTHPENGTGGGTTSAPNQPMN